MKRPAPLHHPLTRFVLGALSLCLCAAPARAQFVGLLVSNVLNQPSGVAVDSSNVVYMTDPGNFRVARFTRPAGAVTTLAGSGKAGASSGLGSAASFVNPQGIVAARGGMVVADEGSQLIRFVSLGGMVTNLAGQPYAVGQANGPGAGASFSYPTGLAVDSASNLYVADSQNGVIRKIDINNNVSTFATNFNLPMAVAVDASNNVWVADAGDDVICLVTNGVGVVMAGISSEPGTNDSTVATNAQFDYPSALLFVAADNSFLISDTLNNTVRRLYLTNLNGSADATYAVQTVAGLPGQSGLVDGAPSIAEFDGPEGLSLDPTDLGFYIIDTGNNALRVLQTAAPLPQVSAPVLGYVIFAANPEGEVVSKFVASTSGVFNNSALLAVEQTDGGTQTFINYGPTPSNPLLSSIATPGPGVGTSPQIYQGDGLSTFQTAPSIAPPLPDLTILAVSTAPGRQSSPVVSARYQFVTDYPTITGQNAANLLLTDATVGAQIFYTLDGTEPTTNSIGPVSAGTYLSLLITNNVTFSARAFTNNYAPSAVSTATLYLSNFVGNEVGFTGNYEEGTGAMAILPITVTMAPSDAVLESLQFRVEVTPVNGNSSNMIPFLNLLQITSGDYVQLIGPSPTAEPVGYAALAYTTNFTQGLAIATSTNSGFQIAGSGAVALLEIPIPNTAPYGQVYNLTIVNPSGTSDGLQAIVPLVSAPTRTLTILDPPYLVGDTSPANGYDVGQFGDRVLNNSDVNNALYAAVGIRQPPVGSDAYDAMDAYPPPSGDGLIDYFDWVTILQMSLGLDEDYIIRYRTNNGALVDQVVVWTNNSAPIPLAKSEQSLVGPSATKFTLTNPPPGQVWFRQAQIGAATLTDVTPGSFCSIPIYANILSGNSLAGLQFRAVLSAVGGAPAPGAIEFSPAPNLPAPLQLPGLDSNDIVCAWTLGGFGATLQNSNYLGLVTFQVPSHAQAGESYALHFIGVGGAPDLQTMYQLESFPGTVWVKSAALQPPQITSDEWRVYFFGSITNSLAADSVDADGDGMANWQEYLAGTNPTNALSCLKFSSATFNTNGARGVALHWLTAPGKTYFLEASPALRGGAWTVVNTNLGDGDFFQCLQTNYSAAGLFYQLRLQP